MVYVLAQDWKCVSVLYVFACVCMMAKASLCILRFDWFDLLSLSALSYPSHLKGLHKKLGHTGNVLVMKITYCHLSYNCAVALQLKTHGLLINNVPRPSRLHLGSRSFQYSLPVMVLMNGIVDEALKLWSNSVLEVRMMTILHCSALTCFKAYYKAYYKPYYMIRATFEILPETLWAVLVRFVLSNEKSHCPCSDLVWFRLWFLS